LATAFFAGLATDFCDFVTTFFLAPDLLLDFTFDVFLAAPDFFTGFPALRAGFTTFAFLTAFFFVILFSPVRRNCGISSADISQPTNA
jgi:hypothetical protein